MSKTFDTTYRLCDTHGLSVHARAAGAADDAPHLCVSCAIAALKREQQTDGVRSVEQQKS